MLRTPDAARSSLASGLRSSLCIRARPFTLVCLATDLDSAEAIQVSSRRGRAASGSCLFHTAEWGTQARSPARARLTGLIFGERISSGAGLDKSRSHRIRSGIVLNCSAMRGPRECFNLAATLISMSMLIDRGNVK